MNKIEEKMVTDEEAMKWFRNLLKINTTNSLENELEAANYISDILKEEGIECKIIESKPGRANLIAKLDGGNESPLLMISHLDVVEADEKKWDYPPFDAIIDKEQIWGRGTLDTKHLTIMQLVSLIEMKRNKSSLNRSIYFIATADEENGSLYGMDYIFNSFPGYFENGVVINEGGGFYVSQKDKEYLLLSLGEKGSCTIQLEAKQKKKDKLYPIGNSASFNLVSAVKKVIENPLPPPDDLYIKDLFSEKIGIKDNENNEVDSYFDMESEGGRMLRTLFTYMSTNDIQVKNINIGDIETAEIVFRLLPNISEKNINNHLSKVLNNTNVSWDISDFQEGFFNNINSSLNEIIKESVENHGFNGEILPFIAFGKTDGRFLRNARVFGFSPVNSTTPFSTVLKKVHKPNDSISIESFTFGLNVMKTIVKKYCEER